MNVATASRRELEDATVIDFAAVHPHQAKIFDCLRRAVPLG
jgi:hypothetical protein